jgi:ABC-type uncharacterized transport system YnjBCD ATPase subunit
MESVTATEEARIREACAEDLVGACTDELLAQPDSAPSEEAAKEWWPNPGEDPLGEFSHVTVSYRGVPAVVDVSFPVPHGAIVALIGPSGSGKSSLIRCMNRLNDLVPGAEVQGEVLYRAADLYAPGVDAVEVRKRIGMVFQRPNPFPKTVYDNVAFGPRVLGIEGDLDERVEGALRRAASYRGPDARARTGGDDRDRHPQPATGGQSGGSHRLPDGGDRIRRRIRGAARGVRPYREALQSPRRLSHRGLHQRQVRLIYGSDRLRSLANWSSGARAGCCRGQPAARGETACSSAT